MRWSNACAPDRDQHLIAKFTMSSSIQQEIVQTGDHHQREVCSALSMRASVQGSDPMGQPTMAKRGAHSGLLSQNRSRSFTREAEIASFAYKQRSGYFAQLRAATIRSKAKP